MNIMVLIGTFICILSIVIGVPELRANFQTYVDPYSFILVLGGTIGMYRYWNVFKDFKSVLRSYLV